MQNCVFVSKEDYDKTIGEMKPHTVPTPYLKTDTGNWYELGIAKWLVTYGVFTDEQIAERNQGFIMQSELEYAKIEGDNSIKYAGTQDSVAQPVAAGRYFVIGVIDAS